MKFKEWIKNSWKGIVFILLVILLAVSVSIAWNSPKINWFWITLGGIDLVIVITMYRSLLKNSVKKVGSN